MRVRILVGVSVLAAISALTALAAQTASAEPPVQAGLAKVKCVGTTCGGNGGTCNTPFCYRVIPNGNSITNVAIGTDVTDPNLYSNWCAPGGWSHTIVQLARPHSLSFAAHGSVAPAPMGNCTAIVLFSGPSMNTSFDVGFGCSAEPHEVKWVTSNGDQAGWTFAVGQGFGPVHGPQEDF